MISKSSMGVVVIALAILSIIMVPSGDQQTTQYSKQNTINKRLSNEYISDIYGKKINIFKPKGIVILQGMAAWCSSCTIQAQELKKATETSKDINIILIDIQPGNGNFTEFIKDLPRTWYFISDNNIAKYFVNKYNIKTLDTTIILKDGGIVFRDGYLTPRGKIKEAINNIKN